MMASITDVSLVKRTRWSSNDPSEIFPVENPATGALITRVQGSGPAEARGAVESARRAYESRWRWITPRERGRHLMAAAACLRRHADDIARLETLENGKPLTQSREFDVEAAIAAFEYFG